MTTVKIVLLFLTSASDFLCVGIGNLENLIIPY